MRMIKQIALFTLLIILGAVLFFLGYQKGRNQYVGDICGKIFDTQYGDIKSDDWQALKLAKEECVKKLIR